MAPIETIDCNSQVETLLSRSGLPVSDLHGQSNIRWFGSRDDGTLVGVVGIEAYANVGLLRSLAVDTALRQHGYGQALVRHAEQWANQNGIKALYLLATTAANFFVRLGYQAISRAEAPMEIARTTQFSGLYHSSAGFMCKKLATDIAQPGIGGTG